MKTAKRLLNNDLPNPKQVIIRRLVVFALVFMIIGVFALNFKSFVRVVNMYNYDKYLTSLYNLKKERGLSALQEINSSCIAYIEIEDLDIHLPIVETNSVQEEDYYLTHDFRKRENELGCPYQRYGTSVNQTTNTVFVGHSAFNQTLFKNQKNQSIFGKLNKYIYANDSFNYHIIVETIDDVFNYQVISVLLVNSENSTDPQLVAYNTKNIATQSQFDNFYNTIKTNSLISGLPTAEFGNKFLTLYTCSTETLGYRVIVVAKQV